MKKVACCLMLVLLVSGCAMTGRVSLIDIDLREPVQITAYASEAAIVYDKAGGPVPTPQSISASSWWVAFTDMLQVIKGRIRIISVEWTETDRNQ